jgi:hypothetical protein
MLRIFFISRKGAKSSRKGAKIREDWEGAKTRKGAKIRKEKKGPFRMPLALTNLVYVNFKSPQKNLCLLQFFQFLSDLAFDLCGQFGIVAH